MRLFSPAWHLALIFVGLACAQQQLNSAFASVRVRVPDSATAVNIAEGALKPVYGEKQILSERPYHAELLNGVWTVSGTLHCSDGKGGTTTVCDGGVAVVRISRRSGRVLSMIHYK
jgi:hypothetical protein